MEEGRYLCPAALEKAPAAFVERLVEHGLDFLELAVDHFETALVVVFEFATLALQLLQFLHLIHVLFDELWRADAHFAHLAR